MPKKILVIDDESSITKIIAKIASDLGFIVRTLNQAATAFEVFEEFQPDILILDLIMPDVDGIDVLNQVLAAGTGAKVVVMSGYGKSYLQLGKAVAEFHAHPDVTTLAKPFRRTDLIALLTPYVVQGAAV
ncbi:MAG TPA: response regulator [Rhodopila sp.]|jgi:DNA-binding NtrC family response regulator|nr:response regulator [Rhodopila sp.]